MKISEFNLLEIDVLDGENLIYNGMTEDVPNELKEAHVKIIGMEGKKIITQLEK